MKYCAIYTRYSSDLQKPTSTEDQIRLCERALRELGWCVYRVYSDEEKSGTFMGHRPGFRQLIADARAQKFAYVITEGLDRLSRDLSDIAYFYKAMKFDDIEIYSISNRGFINDMHISFEGLKNYQYTKDLAVKVRRGHRGATSRGAFMGAAAFGYQRVVGFEIAPGTIKIDEDEAKIIRRMYLEFSAGRSGLSIAKSLNRENILSPRGKRWAQSVVCGSEEFGSGILRNELYRGVLIYGKGEYRRDPDTHSRVRRRGPESEKETKLVPHLRIVDDELFNAVKERFRQTSKLPLNERVRPKRLLTGKLFCGCCGASFVCVANGKVRCRGRAFDGTCDNRRGISRVQLERMVLNLLRSKLLHPQLIERYIGEYKGKLQLNLANYHDGWDATEKRERELDKQVARLVAKIGSGQAEGAAGAFIMQEVNRLSADLAKIRSDLASRPAPPPAPLDPEAILERLGVQFDDLQQWIDDPSVDASHARDVFRTLIDRIKLTPVGADSNLTGAGPLAIEIEGKLANFLTAAGDDANCIIQSNSFQLIGLDNTDSVWRILDVIPGVEAVIGSAQDVVSVLRAATGSLSSEAVKTLVVEQRGEAFSPKETRRIASKVAAILPYLKKCGVVQNVAPPSSRFSQWILAEREAELAPQAPTPALQVTEETELALKILEGLTDPPSTKELARRVLESQGLPVTPTKLRVAANRLKYMLLKYQRAGVLHNVSERPARGNKWMLAENWRSKYVLLVKMPIKKRHLSD
jgi:DNA invertase Pin-like site-specific DNA recombinase